MSQLQDNTLTPGLMVAPLQGFKYNYAGPRNLQDDRRGRALLELGILAIITAYWNKPCSVEAVPQQGLTFFTREFKIKGNLAGSRSTQMLIGTSFNTGSFYNRSLAGFIQSQLVDLVIEERHF